MKKPLLLALITIVSGLIIYFMIDLFVSMRNTNNNSNSNSNEEIKEKDTVSIDYEMYQKLRSEVYENETFAILIMNSDDEVSQTFKEEILYSFKNRKSIIYEIDENKLSDVELSEVIRDISALQKYDKPSMMTPTLIISKKGKVVLVQEGLKYSTELIPMLDSEEIE